MSTAMQRGVWVMSGGGGADGTSNCGRRANRVRRAKKPVSRAGEAAGEELSKSRQDGGSNKWRNTPSLATIAGW